MHERRVVVTGVGAITPIGATVAEFWDGLVTGRSGVHAITRFDASPFFVRIGGECRDFDPLTLIDHRIAKRMDRFAQFAVSAAKIAYEDAGLVEDQVDPRRAGVILGTGIGGLFEIEEQHKRLLSKGPSKVSAFTIPKLMANAGSAHIAIMVNFQGINASVATACASAGSAMGDAFRAIRHDLADIIATGGAEAALTPLGVSAFAAMKALSTRNDEAETASRPFDRTRDGFVLSEGAGLLIFEEYEHAKARGAPILCEVIGFGASADASDMVQPEPEGRGAARAIVSALADARINPEDVDYINAHGTSTPLGDLSETKAVKSVFGAAARRTPISSTKSAIGHLLGASGGVEAIACIQAMRHNTLPPTINLHEPDPECDLDYVPNTARDANVRISMSNSFGFGGHNACLVFRKL
ncbi:MAG: beta-ketoacyl-ACP synthase II [Planctomycetes bacterium]|nr:beta-ketoacyl-ACP synthase II [Planctomycetota bacterium]